MYYITKKGKRICSIGLCHRYRMTRLSLQVVYLWRHVSSTAPPFILWWSNLEILFGLLHRSSPFIGELRCQAILMEHGPYIAERTQNAVYIVRCLWSVCIQRKEKSFRKTVRRWKVLQHSCKKRKRCTTDLRRWRKRCTTDLWTGRKRCTTDLNRWRKIWTTGLYRRRKRWTTILYRERKRWATDLYRRWKRWTTILNRERKRCTRDQYRGRKGGATGR
jgi:hypothetical protein